MIQRGWVAGLLLAMGLAAGACSSTSVGVSTEVDSPELIVDTPIEGSASEQYADDFVAALDPPSPNRGEEALSSWTQFVLLDGSGHQVAGTGFDGRLWSVLAWNERSGNVSFSVQIHNFVQDASGSPAIQGCDFSAGLISGDATEGYSYREGGRPDVDGFGTDGFDCDIEPTLLEEELALLDDLFSIKTTTDRVELRTDAGVVLQLVKRSS